MLKRRDALFRSNKSDPNAIKLSALIRQQIAEVFEDAEEMQTLYLAEEKKFRKQEKRAKGSSPAGMEQLLHNREQIVKLTFLHVQECEMLEKQRQQDEMDMDKAREQLFEMKEVAHDTKTGGYGVVSLPDVSTAFPDIEISPSSSSGAGVQEGFDQQERNEQRINNMLDQVLDGVIDLKELAVAMGTQLRQTDAVIDGLDVEVQRTNAELDTLNTRLKALLTRVRSPKQLVVDICVGVLFLIMIGLLVKVVRDRYG